MSYSNIRFEANQDGVALVTVSRPEKLNALNRTLWESWRTRFSGAGRSRDPGADRHGSR